MIIKTLHITSFGGLNDCTITLSDGVNIIEGENESGKTSAAMFIKFIFYGLSSKTLKADGASEKARFVNRGTLQAAGYIEAVSDDGGQYRIERSVASGDGGSARERIRIINLDTGDIVTGQDPGEYFFGVPESVFVGTAFVGQNRSVKPDIAGEGASKGSVENLLTSADENIDLSRAVKKLDAVRRELCHKNGSGGEISALRERRANVKRELDETASRAAEILSLSSSVADIKSKIDEYEKTSDEQRRIFHSLGVINTKRKFDSFDATGKQIADLAESVRLIDSSPLGGDFGEVLASAESDIDKWRETKAEYDAAKPDLPDSYDIPEVPDLDRIGVCIESCKKSIRALFPLGIVSLVCGIIAVLAAVGMYFLGQDLYFIPFAASIVLAALGIVFVVCRVKKAKQLDTLLDERDDAEARISAIDILRGRVDEKRELDGKLAEAEEKKNAAVATIEKLAHSVGLECIGSVSPVIAKLHEMLKSARDERAALIAKSDKCKGRLEILAEQLEGTDRADNARRIGVILSTDEGKKAAKMTPDDVKELEKQRDFTQSALRAAVKRKETLDEKLGELGKLSRSPDELGSMLNSLDERINELSLRRDACEVAKEALTKAGEEMRSDVIPRLGRKASEYIKGSTGRYSQMTVDSSFACGLGDGDEYKTAEVFSRGTADLVYIALRVALASEVFREDRPTVVFDESFAHVDSDRLGNMIRMLSEREGQYIVFTCRREETDAARSCGGNVIRLFSKGTPQKQ